MTSTALTTTKRLQQIATSITKAHAELVGFAGRSLDRARYIGELLADAKDLCEHGDWSQWLADNFPGSDRTARAYMRIHGQWAELEGKTAEIAVLGVADAVKLLSSPKPEPFPQHAPRQEPDPPDEYENHEPDDDPDTIDTEFIDDDKPPAKPSSPVLSQMLVDGFREVLATAMDRHPEVSAETMKVMARDALEDAWGIET